MSRVGGTLRGLEQPCVLVFQIEKDRVESCLLMEEKKAVESRLHQEVLKNTELQKENQR